MLKGGGGGALGGLPKALDGAGTLGHIFGRSNDQVATNAAQASGVDSGMMTKFIAMLAPIVMSALGTRKVRSGVDAGGLADRLRSEPAQLGVPAASPTPAAADEGGGFGVDDLISIGGALVKSGALGGPFK